MGGLKSPYRLKTTQNKNNSKMKAVIYARVSSTGERQSTERQILDFKVTQASFKEDDTAYIWAGNKTLSVFYYNTKDIEKTAA